MKAAIESGSASKENVAWCMVELGKLHYKAGLNPMTPRKAYESALRVFPNYHPALAGLGLVAAARGDVSSAIADYKRAQASTPLPDYSAALYDLYTISGDTADAREAEAADRCHRQNQPGGS